MGDLRNGGDDTGEFDGGFSEIQQHRGLASFRSHDLPSLLDGQFYSLGQALLREKFIVFCNN